VCLLEDKLVRLLYGHGEEMVNAARVVQQATASEEVINALLSHIACQQP
jgi:hypothetical protein